MIKNIGNYRIITGDDLFFNVDETVNYERLNPLTGLYDLIGYKTETGKIERFKPVTNNNRKYLTMGNKLYNKIWDIYETGNDKRINKYFCNVDERITHNIDNNGDLIERDYYYMEYENI